jgi:hypothetical protein
VTVSNDYLCGTAAKRSGRRSETGTTGASIMRILETVAFIAAAGIASMLFFATFAVA